MAKYPYPDFDDLELDYSEVEKIVKRMRACVVSQGDICCKTRCVESVICRANVKIRAMKINKTANDMDRYRRNVQEAFLILYAHANCYVEPELTP